MSLIAAPSPLLWTPRAGPWWRLRRRPWRAPTEHLLKRGASGHLLRNTAGHLVKDCATASCPFTCGTPTPGTATVTFSGVTLCGCFRGIVSRSNIVTQEVNGVWDLPCQNVGTPPVIIYYTKLVGNFGAAYDPATDCSGASTTYDRFWVRLHQSSPSFWTLWAFAAFSTDADEGLGSFFGAPVFEGNAAFDNCVGPVTFSNLRDCPGAGTSSAGNGGGGSATVVFS
jgi:hypothetical protein